MIQRKRKKLYEIQDSTTTFINFNMEKKMLERMIIIAITLNFIIHILDTLMLTASPQS